MLHCRFASTCTRYTLFCLLLDFNFWQRASTTLAVSESYSNGVTLCSLFPSVLMEGELKRAVFLFTAANTLHKYVLIRISNCR